MTTEMIARRLVVYPVVYALAALAASLFIWFTHTPPTGEIVASAGTAPMTRADRKREPVTAISAERQIALAQNLSRGTDWLRLEEKKAFGAEKTEAISRALSAGDHASALALVMEELDDSTRSQGLNAVFKSWAVADPAAALEALVKLQDPPPRNNRSQFPAAQGYFHGLNAGPPGTLETHLPEALRKIPYDQAAQEFFTLSCEHLLATGRVDGARLLEWWKETITVRPDLKLSDGVVSLAKAAVEVGELEKKGKLEPAERLTIQAGLFRAIQALPEGDPSADGVSDWLIHMTGGMEDKRKSIDAYETPENPATLAIYMKAAAMKFSSDPPATILPLLTTADDETSRAKADALWSGYVSHRAREKSTLDLVIEFSASGIPSTRQQEAAASIVSRKMGEDSILLTTLVNDLPENTLKDAYRARIADWLQRNGNKNDAEMWRNSVKDPALLEK